MSLTVSVMYLFLPADGVVAMTTTFQGQGLAVTSGTLGWEGVGNKICTFSPHWIT